MKELLAAPSWPASAPAVQAWLGSAVAIKDPTAAVFLRQNGSNLLHGGPSRGGRLGRAGGLLRQPAAQPAPNAPLSLWERGGGEGGQCRRERCLATHLSASPHPNPLPERGPEAPQFYILDGMRSDAPEVGFWNRLAAVVPQAVKIAGVRGAAEIVAEIAAELARRQQEGREDAPPIYLFLYNLGRFRDLRKEDDFGFSSRRRASRPAPPSSSPPSCAKARRWASTP